MKRVLTLLLLVSFVLVSQSSARSFDSQKAFKRLDKNSNGIIEKSEYIQSAKKNFERFDKNDDRKVTLKEAKKTFIGKRKPKLVEAWLERNDVNRDGSVTLDEVNSIKEKTFKQIDSNSDNQLTKDELKEYK